MKQQFPLKHFQLRYAGEFLPIVIRLLVTNAVRVAPGDGEVRHLFLTLLTAAHQPY